MPRRATPKSANSCVINKPKVVPKRPKIASNGHKLPDPLPLGEVLTDLKKNEWRLGKSIGVGGFGEIYLASDDVKRPTTENAKYVIKIEPHSNGPLFTEMHFYYRVGTSEQICEWMKKKKLKSLGMPRLLGSGSHDFRGIKYRFMVIERFGEDLQKLLDRNQRVFPIKTVYTLGLKVLDVLEYIHSNGYIHADVKASNLMTGFGKDKENEVYLIDFGLACRYTTSQGVHKEYKEDLRKAHDGTIEFTSRDAHIGVHSRRGDLEILGYNMLQWLCGRLPWEDNLKDPNYVSQEKTKYMKNIPSLMSECFNLSQSPPQGILDYFKFVANLKFEEEPDYEACRNILRNAVKWECQENGFKDDGKLVYISKESLLSPAARKRSLSKASGSDIPASVNKMRKISKAVRKNTSESLTHSPSPCKKVRRVASAKPGLHRPSKSPESPDIASGFTNPTPAMLAVIKRKVDQMKDPESAKRKNGGQTKAKAGVSRNGMKENKPVERKQKSSWLSDESDVTELPKVGKRPTAVKKRLPAPKPKATTFKTKRKTPVSSRIKLRLQTNSCSL